MRYSAPRGTQDILPEESSRWQYLEGKFRETCRLYGYNELRTPTFEETELFTRSIGEHTDIVSKEMYTFLDRANRSMTLRAEGTAPVVRAYLQHNLFAQAPVSKFYYITSVFRYERPQAGRLREHHQVGVEAIGSKDPAIDAEVISLLIHYLDSLGIRGFELRINSVGCAECRPAYRDALKKTVAPVLRELCETCRTRYETNPLRMLDCKTPRCKELMANVPGLTTYLCQECDEHLAGVLQYLQILGTPYVVDPKLVRGFDYYTKTAFEVVSTALGAQNALGGGGRYDRLVEEMGGPPTPAVGFGAGIERILMTMSAQGISVPSDNYPSVFVTTIGDQSREAGIKLLADLRHAGISADTDYSGKSLKAQMKAADRLRARLTVIIGEDELARGLIKIRNMGTGTESEVRVADAVTEITKALEHMPT